MSDAHRKATILIVDDNPASQLALEVALEALGESIVKAGSGTDALRHLLRQDFAVILLDVNMPGLDGFETATLIRERQHSSHIPIIFITAYADDMHVARGYSLGAVDYILAPIVPEVLRTKVAVFVDLYRKNEQIRQQAESLGRRAARLHELTAASLAIHSATSIDRLITVVTDVARGIVGSRWASSLSLAQDGKTHCCVVDEHGPRLLRGFSNERLAGLAGLVRQGPRAMRLSKHQLAEHDGASGDEGPRESWLGVALRDREGRHMGVLQLADRIDGEFTDEDEAVLVQLAEMTSIAIENILFIEERDANRAKVEFLATLSHELRTPLNAILGWTQLLRARAGSQSAFTEGLAVIERNVKAQNRLIEDLLDVSRIARGEVRLYRRATDLAPLLEAAATAALPAADAKRVTLSVLAVPTDIRIHADPDRLQQVFGNLLSNAIKFTPSGGTIEITAALQDRAVEIAVADTGVGIDPDFLPFVFEPFRQGDGSTTRRFSGLGIGLTIVRHIVELHGGSARAVSAGKNRGTTMIVTLPLVSALLDTGGDPVELFALRRTERRVDFEGVRILVVDDEDDACTVVAETFRRQGALVTRASSAAAAFATLERHPPDVVISDLAMPDEDGFSLIRRIRRLPAPHGAVPAIALSALAAQSERAEALAAGFQIHLAKPCDPSHLVATVSNLLTQSRASRTQSESTSS